MARTPARISDDDLKARCLGIELLLLDVDGVLTDGVIALDDRGAETKHFHVRDGAGVSLWRRAGFRAAILSGRSSPAVDRRAAELGIAPVIQGVASKLWPFRDLLHELELEAEQVAYLGDDLPDLPVLTRVGLAGCPADAAPEVREAVHVVTGSAGGRGAVREFVEVILKARGVWPEVVGRFLEADAP